MLRVQNLHAGQRHLIENHLKNVYVHKLKIMKLGARYMIDFFLWQ